MLCRGHLDRFTPKLRETLIMAFDGYDFYQIIVTMHSVADARIEDVGEHRSIPQKPVALWQQV